MAGASLLVLCRWFFFFGKHAYIRYIYFRFGSFVARSRARQAQVPSFSSWMRYYIIRIRIEGYTLNSMLAVAKCLVYWDMTYANGWRQCTMWMRIKQNNMYSFLFVGISFSFFLSSALWSARVLQKRWETSSGDAEDEPIMCLNAYVEWHYRCHFVHIFFSPTLAAFATESVGNFRLGCSNSGGRIAQELDSQGAVNCRNMVTVGGIIRCWSRLKFRINQNKRWVECASFYLQVI